MTFMLIYKALFPSYIRIPSLSSNIFSLILTFMVRKKKLIPY